VLNSRSGILRYAVRKQSTIGRATIVRGSLSYGIFTVDDPFVTYCWHAPDGVEIAWYVNEKGGLVAALSRDIGES
jgi:hypothetical protein